MTLAFSSPANPQQLLHPVTRQESNACFTYYVLALFQFVVLPNIDTIDHMFGNLDYSLDNAFYNGKPWTPPNDSFFFLSLKVKSLTLPLRDVFFVSGHERLSDEGSAIGGRRREQM